MRTFLSSLKRNTVCSLPKDESTWQIALSERKVEAKSWREIPKFVLDPGVIKFL